MASFMASPLVRRRHHEGKNGGQKSRKAGVDGPLGTVLAYDVAKANRVDKSGTVSIYNKSHYVGGRYTGKTVYVSVDPLRCEWLFRDELGNHVRTQPAEQLCRERIVNLMVSDRR
jgi:hypothetical protein